MNKSDEAKIVDLVVRLLFLGLFTYSAIIMVAPLAGLVIWAVILCVALYPLFDWLQRMLGGHKKLSATLIVLVGLVLTLGPIASAVSSAFDVGADLSGKVTSGDFKVPPVPDLLSGLPLVGSKIAETWALVENNLAAAVAKYGVQVLDFVGTVFGKAAGIGMSLLGLALSVVIMGLLFSPGAQLATGFQHFANRVFAPRGGEFVIMAGATVRNVTKGVIGVSAIQAFAVWVLLAAFGIKSAATLALICMILSIIQLGPMIILIPIAIYAWSTDPGTATLLFTVFAVPVGIMDGFLRPIFISKGLQTPMLVILVGVIGGMMAYGLIGVFIGPVLLAVFYELFMLWLSSDVETNDEAQEGAT